MGFFDNLSYALSDSTVSIVASALILYLVYKVSEIDVARGG